MQTPRAVAVVTVLALSAVGLAVGGPAPAARAARADVAPSAELQSALATLNSYRADAGTPAAVLDPGMNAGAQAHASYMQANDVLTHTEDPSLPGYSAAGSTAAGCGDEAPGAPTYGAALDEWMRAPYHEVLALGLDGSSALGFGRDTGYASLTCATSLATGPVPAPATVAYPATFPAEGQTLGYYTFGGESPDPRTGCAAQGLDPASVTGYNLLASFGAAHGAVSAVTTSLVPAGGAAVPVCIVDEATTTDVGQQILAGEHTVIALPRDPLLPGTSYTWTVTADGTTVVRHFTTAAAQLTATVVPFNGGTGLTVLVDSPTGAATGTVSFSVRAAKGTSTVTAPVVATGSLQPGTATFYANVFLPQALSGHVSYLVQTDPLAGYLPATVAGAVDLPVPASRTVTTKPAPTCRATTPATAVRVRGAATLKVAVACSGFTGSGTLTLQRLAGRHWVSAGTGTVSIGGRVSKSLRRDASRGTRFRWVLTRGRQSLLTSAPIVVS